MARFYAEIQGQRGAASRLGSSTSGIAGHIRGWNVGCRVDVRDEDGVDVVRVWRTAGSNGRGGEQLIAEFTSDMSLEARSTSPDVASRFMNLDTQQPKEYSL